MVGSAMSFPFSARPVRGPPIIACKAQKWRGSSDRAPAADSPEETPSGRPPIRSGESLIPVSPPDDRHVPARWCHPGGGWHLTVVADAGGQDREGGAEREASDMRPPGDAAGEMR